MREPWNRRFVHAGMHKRAVSATGEGRRKPLWARRAQRLRDTPEVETPSVNASEQLYFLTCLQFVEARPGERAHRARRR